MSDDDGGYRRNDRQTSKDAAKSFSATKKEMLVYKAILAFGDNGANWWELEQSGGDMLRQTISPRFAPLCRKGYITEKRTPDGEIVKRPGATPQTQTVWIAIQGREKVMTFNLGRAIMEVRAIEAKMKELEDEFNEKQIKPRKAYVDAKRTEILEHLNETGQKSAQTEYGGTYWKPKVTYRVQDKDEFKRHVIGMEQWELLSWAAAPNACEDFTNENAEPPPGTLRNSVNILYITAPTKANAKGNGASHPAEAAE